MSQQFQEFKIMLNLLPISHSEDVHGTSVRRWGCCTCISIL